jgi:hypothetical protein
MRVGNRVLEDFRSQAGQRSFSCEAREKSILRLSLRTGSPPGPENRMWREIEALLQHSIIPVLQSLLRRSEAINGNEPDKPFPATGTELLKLSDWQELDRLWQTVK